MDAISSALVMWQITQHKRRISVDMAGRLHSVLCIFQTVVATWCLCFDGLVVRAWFVVVLSSCLCMHALELIPFSYLPFRNRRKHCTSLHPYQHSAVGGLCVCQYSCFLRGQCPRRWMQDDGS